MCDKKVPIDERYRLPVICDGDEIVAVPFVGVSDLYSVKNEKNCADALTIKFYLF
jgi:hypothetical protein